MTKLSTIEAAEQEDIVSLKKLRELDVDYDRLSHFAKHIELHASLVSTHTILFEEDSIFLDDNQSYGPVETVEVFFLPDYNSIGTFTIKDKSIGTPTLLLKTFESFEESEGDPVKIEASLKAKFPNNFEITPYCPQKENA